MYDQTENIQVCNHIAESLRYIRRLGEKHIQVFPHLHTSQWILGIFKCKIATLNFWMHF